MNFNIPNPCEEDYSKMTLVEGGVFCKSCEKKVHDLTQKTNTEIKSFFEEQKGAKSCIRIAKTQIQELNFDGFFSKFRLWNFRKKISVIIYLFFGIGITSCGDEIGKAEVEKSELTEAKKINWEEAEYSQDRNIYGGADYINYLDNDSVERSKGGDAELGFPGPIDLKAMGWEGKLKEKLPYFEEEKEPEGYGFVHGSSPDYKYEASDDSLHYQVFEHKKRRDASGNEILWTAGKTIDTIWTIPSCRGRMRIFKHSEDDFLPFRGNSFSTKRDSAGQ